LQVLGLPSPRIVRWSTKDESNQRQEDSGLARRDS
jgi:hypothetical protein